MARPSNEMLSQVPLFAGLEPRDLDRIADSFKQRNYSAGDTIASEGSGGAGFFVIGEGTAKVTVHGEERATLGPGQYFGEIALLDEGARTATVTAETDMTTYAMTFWEFRPIVETDARIAWKLVQAARAPPARSRRALSLVSISKSLPERDEVVPRARRVARQRHGLGAGDVLLDDAAEDDAAGRAGAAHDLARRLAERRRRVDTALAGDDEVERGGVEPDRVEHVGRSRHELGAERRERGAEPARCARAVPRAAARQALHLAAKRRSSSAIAAASAPF